MWPSEYIYIFKGSSKANHIIHPIDHQTLSYLPLNSTKAQGGIEPEWTEMNADGIPAIITIILLRLNDEVWYENPTETHPYLVVYVPRHLQRCGDFLHIIYQ